MVVPKPEGVRILGQHIQQGRGNKPTLDRLDTMTSQKHKTKEKEAVQLVQAFIFFRVDLWDSVFKT
ncbi:hypothetical protein HPB47_003504 [Ixodes persulcatus]|uniref:Uncharacterized protein n=1 Tax=Ixodes persulcatus TaxID=34615 RepID=A0AC60PIB5_IXOPE|nr:hypothetical protein HPB47_003504 [Ixodes persulcatus]